MRIAWAPETIVMNIIKALVVEESPVVEVLGCALEELAPIEIIGAVNTSARRCGG